MSANKKKPTDLVLSVKVTKDCKELVGHLRRLIQLDANPEVVPAEAELYARFVEQQLIRCASSMTQLLKVKS